MSDDGLKEKIALALINTAGELNPQSKEDTLRRAMIYLNDIEKNPEFQIFYQEEEVALCAPIYVEEKKPSGNPVTFSKKREGIIVLFSDSFILAREKSFAFHKNEALGFDEVSVEKTEAVFSGTRMSGVRITSNSGKLNVAIIPHQALHGSEPAKQEEISSRIYEAIRS